MKKMNLSNEEQELLREVEAGEWKPVKLDAATVARYQRAARNSLRKDQRLNIRISSPDLAAIQGRAAEEGLPYQTLIASLIHKYATGKLQER